MKCYRCGKWPCECSDGQTIIHGDCREVLPMLGRFDVLLTDPPYGIDEANGKNKSRGRCCPAKDYGTSQWDKTTCEDGIESARAISRQQIVFGGNYYNLPPSRGWLVWDKENGSNDFADGELAWTNLKQAVRIKRHQWNGMLRKSKEYRNHPTQKPLDVIRWALSFTEGNTVIDPFMGSGTTLLAAKLDGRQCTGIELEANYCEAASVRLSQGVLAFA